MNEARNPRQTLLILLAALALASIFLTLFSRPVSAYRPEIVNVTNVSEDGHIQYDNPDYIRTNDSSYILSDVLAQPYRAYIEFNISTVPPNALIGRVEVRYKTESDVGSPEIYSMETQPSVSSNSTVFVDCYNGTKYVSLSGQSTETWYTTDLGTSAASDMQDQLDASQTWFAIGIWSDAPTEWHSEESDDDPILYVYYHRAGDYVVNLDGLTWENGTSAGAADVSAYLSNETITFEVNGSQDYHFWERPILFSWDIGSGNARRMYTYTDNENFTLHKPETTYAVYEFEIKDYTGRLGNGGYLESLRTIGGDNYLIERMAIIDVINDVPLNLVTSQTYTIRVRFEDGTIYTFGFFVSGVDPTPTIAITDIQFDQRTQIVYRHVQVEATRPTPTQITVNYNDTRQQTTWVNLTIAYRNETTVYTASTGNDTAQFNWASANAHLDYLVIVQINHEFYGLLTYREIVAPTRVFYDFIDIGIVGSFGPISTRNLFSFIIVSLVALSCSLLSAELGAFVGLAVAGLLRAMGANDFSYTILAVCFVFVVIYALTKRRGTA